MSRYDKLYDKLNNSPNNADYNDLHSLLEHYGFDRKRIDATHAKYSHPQLVDILTIIIKGNKVKKAVYVINALKMINQVKEG